MKAIRILLVTALSLTFSTVSAQITQEQRNERKEIYQLSTSQLDEKISKSARKEAKKLEKEGWLAAPGTLSLEKQLDKTYRMQMEYDKNLYPKYLIGEAMSTGTNYDAAKMQALELAKQNLAGQIQTEVTALIEYSVVNKQLDAEQATSLTQTVMASKSRISQNLGRTITVIELYRVKQNKNKEVLVRIAYNGDWAKTTTKKAIHPQIEEKDEELHQKLDELLGK